MAALLATATLPAHEGLVAVVEVSPAQPVVGEACQLTLRFESTAGQPVDLPDARVWFSATMSGHPMPPVETELAPASDPRERTGRVTFTMAGPWQATVRMQEFDDVMEAELALIVAAGAASPGAAANARQRYKLPLSEPPRPTLFRPWVVAVVALGLLAAAIGGAAALRLRSRSKTAPAS